jgi:hypothetical protein
MTRDNSSTRKEVHDENQTEDEVVYLGTYGKFHPNRPGIGKSMTRLEEFAPYLTSTPSESESKIDTVLRPHSPLQEDHYQPLSPYEQPQGDTDSSSDEDDQPPLSPECSSPSPGENHRSYCCVERCNLAKRFRHICDRNRIPIKLMQQELSRVNQRLTEEQNFNSNLFMLDLNITIGLQTLKSLLDFRRTTASIIQDLCIKLKQFKIQEAFFVYFPTERNLSVDCISQDKWVLTTITSASTFTVHYFIQQK